MHVKNVKNQKLQKIQEELAKLKGSQYFSDFDLTNAFHQFRLSRNTSEKLSIMTLDGMFVI